MIGTEDLSTEIAALKYRLLRSIVIVQTLFLYWFS